MLTKAEFEAKVAELETTAVAERAEVTEAIQGLESVVADLKTQLESGADYSESFARVEGAIAAIKNIYTAPVVEALVEPASDELDTVELI